MGKAYIMKHGEWRRSDGGLRPSEHLSEFEAFAKPDKETKILDLGCGVGRNYIKLSGKGLQVYGAEIKPEVVREASKEVKMENIRNELSMPASLVACDGNHLPFPDKTFDAVYADSIHADDIMNWNEVFRVVKDKGSLFIKILYKFDFYKDEDKHLNRSTPVESVRSWFDVPGFEVEMRKGVHDRKQYKNRTHETKYLIAKMRKS